MKPPQGREEPAEPVRGKAELSIRHSLSPAEYNQDDTESGAPPDDAVGTDTHPREAAAEEGQHLDEEETSEPEELKRVTACRKPTRRQIEDHEDENHSAFREWCEVCLAARGTGAPHRRRRGVVQEEQEGPHIMSDYFYMNDD